MNVQYDTRLRDKDATEFYNSRERKLLRQIFLIIHSLCVECRKVGKLVRASVVDYIIPTKQGGSALDENNLKELCASYHGAKSFKEGSRFRTISVTRS